MTGSVRLICVRVGNGVHETPARVRVTPGSGLEGDRWAKGPRPDPEAEVTLMEASIAERVTAGAPLDTPGDNFLVDMSLAEDALPAGTRLHLGTVVLEVSAKPHTGCGKFKARVGAEALQWVNGAPRRRGLNCRVIVGGEVAVGDAVVVMAAEP